MRLFLLRWSPRDLDGRRRLRVEGVDGNAPAVVGDFARGAVDDAPALALFLSWGNHVEEGGFRAAVGVVVGVPCYGHGLVVADCVVGFVDAAAVVWFSSFAFIFIFRCVVLGVIPS